MYAAIVKALNDTNGPDISGKVVPMPAGSYHLVSKAALPFFKSHPDVFQVTYEADDASPAMLSTDASGNTVLVGADGGTFGLKRSTVTPSAFNGKSLEIGVHYTTLLDAIKDLAGRPELYEIVLRDGDMSESVVTLSSFDMSNIALKGKTRVDVVVTSVQSCTQVSGYAHDVVLNCTSVAGLDTNDYLAIRYLAGGTNKEQLYGTSKITAVDTPNNRITLRIKLNTAFKPSGTFTGRTAYVNKSRITTAMGVNSLAGIKDITFVNAGGFTLKKGGRLGFEYASQFVAMFNTVLTLDNASSIDLDYVVFGGGADGFQYVGSSYNVRGHMDGYVFGNNDGTQIGMVQYSGASISAWKITAVNCDMGLYVTDLCAVAAVESVFVDCAQGILAETISRVNATTCTYTRCTTNTTPLLNTTAADGSFIAG